MKPRNLAKLALAGAIALTLGACIYEPAPYAPAPAYPAYGYYAPPPAYYGYGPSVSLGFGYGGGWHDHDGGWRHWR